LHIFDLTTLLCFKTIASTVGTDGILSRHARQQEQLNATGNSKSSDGKQQKCSDMSICLSVCRQNAKKCDIAKK